MSSGRISVTPIFIPNTQKLPQMKRLIFTILLGSAFYYADAQKFYIQTTDKGYETKVQEKMNYDGYSLVSSEREADYKIECLVATISAANLKYKGYIRVTDIKTGKEVGRTKEISKKATIFRGYNAANAIFEELSQKQLPAILKSCK
ncbi:hypothetical protein D3C72_1481130 [compost metagenome]